MLRDESTELATRRSGWWDDDVLTLVIVIRVRMLLCRIAMIGTRDYTNCDVAGVELLGMLYRRPKRLICKPTHAGIRMSKGFNSTVPNAPSAIRGSFCIVTHACETSASHGRW